MVFQLLNRNSRALRTERLSWRRRAFLQGFQLKPVVVSNALIRKPGVLCFSTLRNERIRLPYFLDYYRKLDVSHFLIVDNGSDDGSREYLAEQPDVSLWTTTASYKAAGFGIDWLNALKTRYAHERWVLVVDVDEFLVYPYVDSRPLPALTDWLDANTHRNFGAMMIDLYGKDGIAETPYQEGEDPVAALGWFDAGNYTYSYNSWHDNLWIQGGPRQRAFFADDPKAAPALNKTPLVKWRRGHVFISSTHTLLPRRMNRVFDDAGGERTSGALLHAKFLSVFADKAKEEVRRRQHYAESREYLAYRDKAEQTQLWTDASTQYRDWHQLEQLGLISTGGWL
ncbi:glycosyltransferase family 2 protein [Halovulum sp. GXIMD14793]